MADRPSPAPLPFSSFGWSLTGALLIALSLPPLGLYPLAWVGLVPLIARWALRGPTLDYLRETYALFLTTSCCVGFWLLFNPDPQAAALGGISLFWAPVTVTLAFYFASVIKEKAGLYFGLVALALNVVAAEFLVLTFDVSVPWLLLGHTQVEAVDFIQMADLGGVLLLSLWVLLLNGAAFMALPRTDRPGARYGERGASIAVFTALVALPVAYGSIRTAQSDVPAGYTRVGIVQPGLHASDWEQLDAVAKVDYLAELSDDLLGRWTPADPASARSGGTPSLLVWPQSSLPFMGTERAERQLYDRLQTWAARRDITLLAGAHTATDAVDRRYGTPQADEIANSAVLIRPGRSLVRYDQMRPVRFADFEAAPGSQRVLLEADGVRVATAVGFESLYGDHLRRFTAGGANLFVVLSRNDLWGRSAGLYQHLQITRLRAIESRRAVLLSSVSGVSAFIGPSGRIDQIGGWMDQDAEPVEVPTYRGETFYVRHGDWVGVWALVLGLLFSVSVAGLSVFAPELMGQVTRIKPSKRRRSLART